MALFEDSRGTTEALSIVLDERIFSDTVLRAIRISPTVFVVCDIWALNGTVLHEQKTFLERRTLLESLLDEFHSPDLTALVLPEHMPRTTLLRGYEYYDDSPGTIGIFLPAVE